MMKPHFHLQAVLIPPPDLLRAGAKPEGMEVVVADENVLEAVSDCVQATLKSGVLDQGGAYTLMVQRCAAPAGHIN